MNEPIRTQWEIRCAFNGFCKQALKREAMNAHRDTKRQQSREVTFSDLSPQEENQLYTYDKYFADDEAEQSFFIAGKEITAKLLAGRKTGSCPAVLFFRYERERDRKALQDFTISSTVPPDKLFRAIKTLFGGTRL